MACLPLFDEHQGEVIPPTVGFLPGVDLEAVMPGGLEGIDATGFHHGPDPEFG